ncbi:MAG TPA: ATP-binding protein, partial [Phnomibacter sp.]|nr:ATP-binding protein [Phnomibacter sp.]
SALKYYKLFKSYADSINNQQTEKRAMNLAAEYEYSKKELLLKAEFDSKNTRQNWIIFSAFAALISSLVVAGLIYRSRMKEKRSNQLLQQKNEEIDGQRNSLEKALTELKAAQNQLIQAEKMASLGEMTAGIAHEIQNPLNFVNNFSEVSVELVQELGTALQQGDNEEANALITDLTQNLDKINHHGKRAGAIVRSMLQHSRSNSDGKEPTDINALCDEYLRLAYHGLRAKDKTFNAIFETQLDPTVGKLNIIPQEIGRVLLNLINNAFYAVSQRQKALAADENAAAGEKYVPSVWVQTRNLDKQVEIRITDNGTGIPSHLADKVFQPFFTTKPTGEGTGLGLSLSYDIVTNGHQGQLQLESKEQNGTTFIILLPKNA